MDENKDLKIMDLLLHTLKQILNTLLEVAQDRHIIVE